MQIEPFGIHLLIFYLNPDAKGMYCEIIYFCWF